jgi:hypothetical protein
MKFEFPWESIPNNTIRYSTTSVEDVVNQRLRIVVECKVCRLGTEQFTRNWEALLCYSEKLGVWFSKIVIIICKLITTTQWSFSVASESLTAGRERGSLNKTYWILVINIYFLQKFIKLKWNLDTTCFSMFTSSHWINILGKYKTRCYVL